ncbi:unnamed protein product [Orchesella dallaii]|uniref:Uncharacterized protein n=1 Tax=Orchesella dallaii TaxID=48710 RepID=A0ABP1PX11_9HEXA
MKFLALQELPLSHHILLPPANHAPHAEDSSNPDYADDEDYDDEEEPTNNAIASITSEPKIIEADPGQTVELPCRGENLQHVAVIWQKGNTILAAGEVVVAEDKRFRLSPEHTELILDNVTSKDAGEYTCKTTSARAVEVTHTIRVFEQPRASVRQASRVVKNMESATLSCDVTGYPEPTVTWERKGKMMPTGDTKIEGTDLTFARVSRHYAGTYECVAHNDLGAARTAIQLVVLHIPEIEVAKLSVNSGEGVDAELSCIVHAEPKAIVVWYKDGKQLNSNKHVAEEKHRHFWTLHVKNVQENDFGNYSCVANNSLGFSNAIISLTGAPSQPTVTAEHLGKDHMSFTLVWTLESAVKIEEYRIRWRKNDEDWQETTVSGEDAGRPIYNLSYTFRDLIPSSDYEVTVAAHNQYGWSLEAEPKKLHINGEHQSLAAESEPGAKAIGTGDAGCLRPTSSFLSQLSFAFILASIIQRWQ